MNMFKFQTEFEQNLNKLISCSKKKIIWIENTDLNYPWVMTALSDTLG